MNRPLMTMEELLAMPLHTGAWANEKDWLFATRVPGGWFYTSGSEDATGCFVPEPPMAAVQEA